MIGYENNTSHSSYAAMCRAEDEQDAFERRVEAIEKELAGAAIDAEDVRLGAYGFDNDGLAQQMAGYLNLNQMADAYALLLTLIEEQRLSRIGQEARAQADKERNGGAR